MTYTTICKCITYANNTISDNNTDTDTATSNQQQQPQNEFVKIKQDTIVTVLSSSTKVMMMMLYFFFPNEQFNSGCCARCVCVFYPFGSN